MHPPLPAGYVERDSGRARLIATRLDLAEMAGLLDGPRRDAAPDADVAGGRGGTRRVRLLDGRNAYLRQYLRGGWMGRFNRDRYWLRPPRPLLELVATEQARAAGCRAPIVHAVLCEEGFARYRGWIVTAAFDGASAFADVYAAADSADRRGLLVRAGRAVRALADAGVYHIDLTGHNLLVDGHDELAVIDFDRAVRAERGRTDLASRCVDRLLRSLAKLERESGRAPDGGERRWLDEGYRGS